MTCLSVSGDGQLVIMLVLELIRENCFTYYLGNILAGVFHLNLTFFIKSHDSGYSLAFKPG